MKILYIITQADEGGAQTYVLSLAKHFHGAIASGSEAEKLFLTAHDLGLETFKLQHLKRNINPYHDLMAILEIRELIKSENPDIVHLNSSKAGFLGSLASIGLKTKIVFTAHGFIFLEPMNWLKKSFYMALEKLASEFRSFIITVSEKDRQSALLLKLIAENKIATVHNGLKKIDFLAKTDARTKLNLTENKFIFGTVANFYKTKGLDVLIEAVTLLPEDIKKLCIFVLIGSGPEEKKCKLKIENYKLTDSFLLVGNLPNALIYLTAFNAFILPSRKEGFPYALLEAMQAELPIIATNVGGIPEALGEAGILCAPENPHTLTKAIIKLFYDSNLQNQLKHKALERAKLFTEDKMLQETENIYKLILKS